MYKYSVLALLAGVSASNASSADIFAENSESRELMKIHGIMAAAFTPLNQDGNLDFKNLELMAQRYKEWGIHNVMIGGTTGESVSFSYEERSICVQKWLDIASKYDLDIYVHVGMNSVQEAAKLAKEVSLMTGSDDKKVQGILAMPPTYFRPSTPQ